MRSAIKDETGLDNIMRSQTEEHCDTALSGEQRAQENTK